jgi:hypothetical protein
MNVLSWFFRQSDDEAVAGWDRLVEPPLAPGSYPVLGHVPLLRSNGTALETIGSLALQMQSSSGAGPIFTLDVMKHRVVVISDVHLAEEINRRLDDFGKM